MLEIWTHLTVAQQCSTSLKIFINKFRNASLIEQPPLAYSAVGDSGCILVIIFDTQLSETEAVFVLVQHFAR